MDRQHAKEFGEAHPVHDSNAHDEDNLPQPSAFRAHESKRTRREASVRSPLLLPQVAVPSVCCMPIPLAWVQKLERGKRHEPATKRAAEAAVSQAEQTIGSESESDDAPSALQTFLALVKGSKLLRRGGAAAPADAEADHDDDDNDDLEQGESDRLHGDVAVTVEGEAEARARLAQLGDDYELVLADGSDIDPEDGTASSDAEESGRGGEEERGSSSRAAEAEADAEEDVASDLDSDPEARLPPLLSGVMENKDGLPSAAADDSDASDLEGASAVHANRKPSVDMASFDAHFEARDMHNSDEATQQFAPLLAAYSSAAEPRQQANGLLGVTLQATAAPCLRPDQSTTPKARGTHRQPPTQLASSAPGALVHPRIQLAPVLGDQGSSEPQLPALTMRLLQQLTTYTDLLYTDRTFQDQTEIRLAYLVHVLNHINKGRSRVLENNHRLEREARAALQTGEQPGRSSAKEAEVRDQGFTRPKALVVVPYRHAALALVEQLKHLMVNVSSRDGLRHYKKSVCFPCVVHHCAVVYVSGIGPAVADQAVTCCGAVRFKREFGTEPSTFQHPCPEYHQYFEGNNDDCFAIGVRRTPSGTPG